MNRVQANPNLVERVSSTERQTTKREFTLAGYIVYKAELASRAQSRASRTSKALSSLGIITGDKSTLPLMTGTYLCPQDDYAYTDKSLEEVDADELGWLAQGYEDGNWTGNLPLVQGVVYEATRRLAALPLDTPVNEEVAGYLAAIEWAQQTANSLEEKSAS